MPHTAAALSLALAMVSTPLTTTTNTVSAVTEKPIAQQLTVPCDTRECVEDLIEFYAEAYGVDKDLALEVAKCESEFKPTAVGDNGKAYGVFQFHRPTFAEFSKKFGNAELKYKNTENNIELAVWALSQGKGAHWTCYRKITSDKNTKLAER